MADQEKSTWSTILTGVADLITPDNIQRYLLGTKKNGQYRAVYDVVKDYTSDSKKKKKKGKKDKNNTHSLYLSIKGKKKRKKKQKHFRLP